MARITAGVLLVALGFAGLRAPVQAQDHAPQSEMQADFDCEGYRASRYRAPVDRVPSPARRIPLETALRLHGDGKALFIDVLPVEGGYRDPASGVWRLSQRHATIAGAQWHPETGRAAPEPVLWQALAGAVAAARKDRPRLAVVLFCRSDCWMGWNAARRLARAGARRVFWLAEGIEGWNGAGRALVDAEPVAVPK